MPDAPLVLFADFTCPFSCVTEAALRQLLSGTDRAPEYHAFELHPAPLPLPAAPVDEAGLAALRPLADEAGVRLERPGFVPRTRKAHEAAIFARLHGREDALRGAVYRAYWREGRDIGRIDVLCSLGEELGLDALAMKIALDIDAREGDVVRSREAAERMGVLHTPTLIVGGGGEPRVMVGAHPMAELREMLGRAD